MVLSPYFVYIILITVTFNIKKNMKGKNNSKSTNKSPNKNLKQDEMKNL